MERRFKLGIVSFHELMKYGDNFDQALKASLPECVEVVMSTKDFAKAQIEFILYSPKFEAVPLNANLERLEIEINPKKMEYNH